MAEEKFLDLFDVGKGKEDDEGGTLASVIKNEDLSVSDDDRALIGESKIIESESFVLKLYEKDGIIDSIDIECRCGRKAKIQLEYKKPGSDDSDEFLQADESGIEPERMDYTDALDEEIPEELDAQRDEQIPEDNEIDEVHEASGEVVSGPEKNSVQDPDDSEEDEEFKTGIPADLISAQIDNKESQDQTGAQDSPEEQDSP